MTIVALTFVAGFALGVLFMLAVAAVMLRGYR